MRAAQVTTGTVTSTTRARQRRTRTVETRQARCPDDCGGNQRIARPDAVTALHFCWTGSNPALPPNHPLRCAPQIIATRSIGLTTRAARDTCAGAGGERAGYECTHPTRLRMIRRRRNSLRPRTCWPWRGGIAVGCTSATCAARRIEFLHATGQVSSPNRFSTACTTSIVSSRWPHEPTFEHVDRFCGAQLITNERLFA